MSDERIETIRFLTLPCARRIESVRRRRQWQARLDRERFFDQTFGPKKTTPGS